jgi:hypothetical protein
MSILLLGAGIKASTMHCKYQVKRIWLLNQIGPRAELLIKWLESASGERRR